MKIEDCIRELKVHGFVEYLLDERGEKKPVLTESAVRHIKNCYIVMRAKY